MAAATTPSDAVPILELSQVSKRFGGIAAVTDVSFAVRKGRITGLIGPNGAGKTTLFDIMSGLRRPDSGTVRFAGDPIDGVPPHRMSRRGLGRTFQSVRIFGALTVNENLRIAGHNAGYGRAGFADRAAEVLTFVEMQRHGAAIAGQLSYGQRKLIEIAMVLMQKPQLILLDEPAAGVNPGLVERLGSLLSALVTRGLSLVLVEHNIPFVAGLCHDLVVMAGGRVLASGEPRLVLADAQVLESFLGA
jgi:ABC-type branched-subunit amino acid transport system ATPase component